MINDVSKPTHSPSSVPPLLTQNKSSLDSRLLLLPHHSGPRGLYPNSKLPLDNHSKNESRWGSSISKATKPASELTKSIAVVAGASGGIGQVGTFL